MIKVSVIIPAYNVEKYIHESLDSIITQTLEDVEVIIVNDGSTDKTENIIKSYIEKYKNITLINQENKGPGFARNRALDIAKGKYVYFFDADDILENDALEICFNECEKEKLDFICFDADIFEHHDYEGIYNDFLIRKHLIESKVKKGEELLKEMADNNCFRGESWMNFYNRKFLKKHKILYSEQRIYQDLIQVFGAFLNANKAKFIPNIFVYRRLRNDSAMTSDRGRHNIDGYFRIAMDTYENYKNLSNIQDETKGVLLKFAKYYIIRSISVCDEISDLNYKNEIISKIPNELYDIKTEIQINTSNLFYRNIGIKLNY